MKTSRTFWTYFILTFKMVKLGTEFCKFTRNLADTRIKNNRVLQDLSKTWKLLVTVQHYPFNTVRRCTIFGNFFLSSYSPTFIVVLESTHAPSMNKTCRILSSITLQFKPNVPRLLKRSVWTSAEDSENFQRQQRWKIHGSGRCRTWEILGLEKRNKK